MLDIFQPFRANQYMAVGKGREKREVREGDFNQFITLECKERLTGKCWIFTPKKELRQNGANGGIVDVPK